MKKLLIIMAIIGLLLPGTFSTKVTAQQEGARGVGASLNVVPVPGKKIGRVYFYSVKFLCGTIRAGANPQFPAARQLLVPGTYLTQINIYNPNSSVVDLADYVIPLKPGEVHGPAGHGTVELKAMEGFKEDCEEIKFFAMADLTLESQFFEGFLVLNSPSQLEVVAVYTLKNVEGPTRQ